MLKTTNEEATIPGHVCTIKDPKLANAVLIGLVALSIAGITLLAFALSTGCAIADARITMQRGRTDG